MAYDEIKDTDDFETYEKRLFSQTSLQQRELPREVSSVPTHMNSRSAADSSMDVELVVEGSSNSKIVNSVEQSLIQLQKDSVSVPACTSLGCKKESIAKPPGINYPVDYKVPNFGQDTDIVDSIKNEKDASSKLGGKLAQSRPACTSVEGSCKTGTAAAPNLDTKTVFNLPAGSVVNDVDGGPPGPVGPPFPVAINVLLEQQSRPACDSTGCKTGTAADPNIDTRTVFNLPAGSVVNNVDGGPPGPIGPPFPQAINVLLEQMSVPACTSLGCKKASAALPPTDTLPREDNWGKTDSDWGVYHAPNYGEGPIFAQRQSVPSCTSLGCKKASAALPPTDTLPLSDNWGKTDSDWGVYHAPNYGEGPIFAQRQSVPACTSLGCKKESMAFPPDSDTTDSNWGKSDEHWQPRDAPSVNEKNLASLYQRY